jgi:hypothetical protein
MKKIYTITASVLALATVATAQNARVTTSLTPSKSASIVAASTANAKVTAAGDTILFLTIEKPLKVKPTAVNPGFGLISATLNKSALNTQAGITTPGFGIFYVLRAPGDTNKFFLASSYYATPAMANNYLGFGALTIPAAGATFNWKHTYNDKSFRDGYVVYASTVKPDSANGYAASTRTKLVTILDNDTTTANSTVADTSSNLKKWYQKSVVMPNAFKGMPTYIFVNHNANDMNLLALDEFLVKEIGTVGINALATTTSTLFPNPAANYVTLGNVTVGEVVTVYNMLGSIVLTDKVATTNHTLNIADLNNGTYVIRVGNSTPVRFNVAK